MRCISPILVRKSSSRDFVPCGKCNFCLQVKRADWTFRILQELKDSRCAHFLTLTYGEDQIRYSVSGLPELRKGDVSLFTKRLRMSHIRASVAPLPLRYYLVGEYGSRTERPHYHAIVFNLDERVLARISAVWSHGFVHVGECNQASIHYVTKYVINKEVVYPGREPPFAFMSKRPGIGQRYLRTHLSWHKVFGLRNFTLINGQVGRLPRYYKERIFNARQRARLAREAVVLGDQSWRDEVVRLAQLHVDPLYHYDERIVAEHDRVFSKVNDLNRF